MGDLNDPARVAAAAELVEPGMLIGLGSGRAVWKLTEAPRRAATRSAPPRRRTAELASGLGIEIVELDGAVELDLALDGADEVAPTSG